MQIGVCFRGYNFKACLTRGDCESSSRPPDTARSRPRRSLGYTQPAVSRQIATLEAELGTLLVAARAPGGGTDRRRHEFSSRAGEVIARLQDAEAELFALAGLEGGRLRMASFASAAASIVPLAIARFRERHPAVELSIAMADPIDSMPALRAGELDMALSHDVATMEPLTA